MDQKLFKWTEKSQGSTTRALVAGGGISGLATAYYLQKEAQAKGIKLEVIVLEAKKKAGGVIQTTPWQDCLFEEGPDCFITTKPEAFELSQELGLEDQLISTNPEYRQSFIVSQSKLVPIPKGFFLLAPTSFSALFRTPILSWPAKLRMALEFFIPAAKTSGQDESLAGFVRRRFGKEALERIAQPMVAGIYTADAEKLSLASTFPRFLELEKQYGSVIRGLKKSRHAAHQKRASQSFDGAKQASGPRYNMFKSFRGGMATLVEALIAALPPETCFFQQVVQNISPCHQETRSGWKVELEQAEKPLLVDLLCLAMPLKASARLVAESCPELGHELGGVGYADAAIAHLAFQREQISHPLNGMGFVVPAVEGRKIIGCSFLNVKWEGRGPGNRVLLRVFVGGALHQDIFQRSDHELIELAQSEIQDLLGIKGRPEYAQLCRWPASMAQYEVGHKQKLERIRKLESELSGFALASNGLEGVGIPDCIRGGKRSAQKMLQALEENLSL